MGEPSRSRVFRLAWLRREIRQFAKRPFVRSVMVVAGGGAISQAIALAFSPFITRLYGPQAFGLQSVFMTIAGFMATVASMSYPTAIVLPKSDVDALGLARVSVYVGVLISALATLVLWLYGNQVLALFDAAEISSLRFLIPVSMLASVVGAIVSQWLTRKRQFMLMAKVGVLQTFLTSAVKTGFGFIQPSAIALIVLNTLGGLSATVLMLVGAHHRGANVFERSTADKARSEIWRLAKRHRDFPLYRTPQNLLNAASVGLPVALLAAYFGSTAVGFYAVASSVLAVPAGLIGASVMQVFYPRVNEAFHGGEDAKALVKKATLGLALTGAVPFAVVLIGGPVLFAFVFGPEWHKAGTYAQWLSPWLFLQYINKPAVSAIPALGLQGKLLAYEVFSTGSKVIGLYLGFSLFKSDIAAIALYSAFGVVAYIWLILWVISRCGKFRSGVQGDFR